MPNLKEELHKPIILWAGTTGVTLMENGNTATVHRTPEAARRDNIVYFEQYVRAQKAKQRKEALNAKVNLFLQNAGKFAIAFGLGYLILYPILLLITRCLL